MTSISDTNVVNAPGGLVELGYSEITSPVNVTVASGSYNTIINDMTIVSDGSPLVVEFYSPYISMPAGAPTYIVTALFVDGVVAGYLTESYSSANVGSTLEFPVHGVRRITLSAGVHTIGVRAFRGAVNGQVGANTGIGTNYPPAFLRVSKIIQASQLIVQTPNAPLVTSLPSNAIDGQEVRYLADNTNGIIWNFRYRAGSSSAYKWEFIGGPPIERTYTAGFETLSGSTTGWVDAPTVGPKYDIALAGDYFVQAQVAAYRAASGVVFALGIAKGANQPVISLTTDTYAANAYDAVTTFGVVTSATTDIRMRYYQSAVNTVLSTERRMHVTPIRVSA